jgi:hypothetical protein
MPGDLGAVGFGSEEPVGPRIPRPEQLLSDAADRPHLAVGVDRAGAGDVLAARERTGREGVVDAEGEHHAGARAAHILQVDRHIEREVEHGARQDADDGRVVGCRTRLGRDRHGALSAVAADAEVERGADPRIRDRGAQFGVARDGGTVDGEDLVARLEHTLGRIAVRHLQHGDDRVDLDVELGERRRGGGLLRGPHGEFVLFVGLLLGLPLGVDEVDRHHLAARVEPGTDHLKPVDRVLARSVEVDREQVEAAIGRVGGRTVDADHRHLLAIDLGGAEGVVHGAGPLDDVGRRRDGEHEQHEQRREDERRPHELPTQSGLGRGGCRVERHRGPPCSLRAQPRSGQPRAIDGRVPGNAD